MSFFTGIFSSTVAKRIGQATKDWIPVSVMSGGRSTSGIDVTEDIARLNSAAFASRRAISESFAMIPKAIYRKDGKSRIEQSNHPSADIFSRQANPIQVSYNFFRLIQNHSIGAGNGYAEIELDSKGDAVALWPLPPSRVTPIFDPSETRLLYKIELEPGKFITLPQDRILHIPGVGYDGIAGRPLIEFMVNAIGLGLSMEEYTAKYYEQGAGIPGYVSVPDSFDEDQLTNVRKFMAIQNEGLANAHRWKFLYESMRFTPTGFSPADSDLLKGKVFQIQEIARYHRIPLHKIQENSQGVSWQSLEQFNTEFVNDTLMPTVVLWEQELARKLFPLNRDLYVKFNVNVFLRGDIKTRAAFYRTMVMSGLMTQNEARALEDLDPIEGADVLLTPLNMRVDLESENADKEADAKQRVQD